MIWFIICVSISGENFELESTGYSALPSPPTLMRRAVAAGRTHRHTDAERRNTFLLRLLSGGESNQFCYNRG